MKRLAGAVAVLGFLLVAASSVSMLGKSAPEFGLVDLSDHLVKLSDFKGQQRVVLVFYVNHG